MTATSELAEDGHYSARIHIRSGQWFPAKLTATEVRFLARTLPHDVPTPYMIMSPRSETIIELSTEPDAHPTYVRLGAIDAVEIMSAYERREPADAEPQETIAPSPPKNRMPLTFSDNSRPAAAG